MSTERETPAIEAAIEGLERQYRDLEAFARDIGKRRVMLNNVLLALRDLAGDARPRRRTRAWVNVPPAERNP